MNYYEIAKIIPARFRNKILKDNHIFKAVVDFGDYDMMQLWFYWANLIEPESMVYKYEIRDGRIQVLAEQQCKKCLRTLLDKWILLEPYLVLIEKEDSLLQTLK